MPDLILHNANIITMDPLYPDAGLIAVKDGRITAVAGKDALEEHKGKSTRIIDCSGKTVLPGFIDAHCHFRAFAESFLSVDLSPANHIRSIADIQHQVESWAKKQPRGTWIKGKGYHEFYLNEQRHPDRHDLDRAAPDHPIKISHRTGHAHVLNSLALKRAGITLNTPDPPGGLIDRALSTGEPTGLLYEMGAYLSEKVPSFDKHELEKGVVSANRHLLSMGITSIHDASSGNNYETWKLLKNWIQHGILDCRVHMMLGARHMDKLNTCNFSCPDKDRLFLQGVKIILDETSGKLYPSQQELDKLLAAINRSGMQAAIHAIEEHAVESAIKAIAGVVQQNPDTAHSHRIEHCSVCPPELRKQISALGIMVVTQPGFLFFSGDRYLATVPEHQLQHLYPIKSFLNSGIVTAAGSDCPVAPPNPLHGIYTAVCRKTESGKPVLPDERIPSVDALRMYTLHAARAMGKETAIGSITPGKFADIAVLSDDPLKVPADNVKDIEVDMTLINGEVVWTKEL